MPIISWLEHNGVFHSTIPSEEYKPKDNPPLFFHIVQKDTNKWFLQVSYDKIDLYLFNYHFNSVKKCKMVAQLIEEGWQLKNKTKEKFDWSYLEDLQKDIPETIKWKKSKDEYFSYIFTVENNNNDNCFPLNFHIYKENSEWYLNVSVDNNCIILHLSFDSQKICRLAANIIAKGWLMSKDKWIFYEGL